MIGRPDIESEKLAKALHSLANRAGRTVQVMEVCGTHTMAISRHGLRELLPPKVELLSGPGCPVCVTPPGVVDAMVQLARRRDVTVATFGDMLRVRGTNSSLEMERARGADVRVVASPMDALRLAQQKRDSQVVFLAVGFETTAPAVAATVAAARESSVRNFTAFCSHKLIPPAMEALMESGEVFIDGFLCPGHVSVIIGSDAYRSVAERYRVPCVVAGFEPQDVLEAMVLILRQVVQGRADVENQYVRAVRPSGNPVARRIVSEVFEVCDAEWRGLGVIPQSGLRLRTAYEMCDAVKVFDVQPVRAAEPVGCLCGSVLRGAVRPDECPLFRRQCTPATPVGPCMVSSEGTCAAYYKYPAESRNRRTLKGAAGDGR